MKRVTKVQALASGLLLAAGAMTAGPAQAQAYPSKPIRLVVGFSAGGPTDVPARMVAASLSTYLGQTVVVENRTGAGGKIAADYVASQPADGYTLLLCTHIDAINTVLYKSGVVKLDDLTPVSAISKYYYLAAVANTLPVDNMRDFVAYAKKNHEALNYGQVGKGSSFELLTKRIEKDAGIKMTGISYRGSAEMIQDLLAGRIHFITAAPLSVLPLRSAGKVKLIGTTSPDRLESAPDVPTMKEEGFPITWFGWLGVCGPRNLPQPIVHKLGEALAQAVGAKDFQALMAKSASIPMASTPGELSEIFATTARESQAMIEEHNLQLE
ncbi:MAG TPA: tripartite tricarboxylate transporter substrate binding protein [Bordetella sp.]|nr:tripartite tricarboxylate transporter substrate binding protein [Bordetella sp.]